MIELRTLGGLSVQAEDENRFLTRKTPLALLAILAVAAPHTVARDKLLALLWPDVDQEHARNALNQTLFGIRRGLGRTDVVVGRADLRLNLDVVSSDVVRFLSAGNAADAVTEYTGPFLDGFFLSDAPDFERWVEDTRGRLARRMLGLLREQAAAAERAGDLHAAAEFRWHITEVDPLDSAAALELVRTLAAAGDRTRALAFARRHESLLRQEIGSGVDPAMEQLVMRLLAEGRALPAQHAAATPPVTSRGARPSVEVLAGPGLKIPDSRDRPLARMLFTAAAFVTVTAAAWLSRDRFLGASTSELPPRPSTAVAILPFVVRGTPDADYLGAGLVELISRRIDGAGDLRPVDTRLILRIAADTSELTDAVRANSLARRLAADQFVIGEVASAPSALRISASLYSRGPKLSRVASASVEGKPDELLALVDRITSQLLAAVSASHRPGVTDLASLSTRSLPALRAYLTGQAHRRAGRYAEALEAFQDAVRQDSTFALAWYGLSNVADWASHGDLVIPAAREAARFANRLTEHDRLLAQAYLAWRENRVMAAERMYSLLVHSYPDDAESWYQLGELYFHHNSRRGRSFAEARTPFERVRQLEPGDREALMHLIRIALRNGTRREIDSLTALAMREQPGPEGHEVRAVRAYALDEPSARADALRELASASGVTLAVVAWRVSMYALNLDGADDILRLGLGPDRPVALQVATRSSRAFLLAGMGRRREADEALDWLDARRESARGALTTRATLLLGFDAAPAGPALERTYVRLDSAARVDLARGTADDSAFAFEAACFAGIAAAQSGQDARAQAWLEQLSRARSQAAVERAMVCAGSIRARRELRAGRTTAALELLRSYRAELVPEATFDILDRVVIAEALYSLRRDAEAASWFDALAQRGFEELPFLAPAERRLGQIAERRGDHDAAIGHYRRFAALWAGADPDLRVQVDSVKARVALLSPRSSPTGGAPRGVLARTKRREPNVP